MEQSVEQLRVRIEGVGRVLEGGLQYVRFVADADQFEEWVARQLRQLSALELADEQRYLSGSRALDSAPVDLNVLVLLQTHTDYVIKQSENRTRSRIGREKDVIREGREVEKQRNLLRERRAIRREWRFVADPFGDH